MKRRVLWVGRVGVSTSAGHSVATARVVAPHCDTALLDVEICNQDALGDARWDCISDGNRDRVLGAALRDIASRLP